jgi:hypothetical protein
LAFARFFRFRARYFVSCLTDSVFDALNNMRTALSMRSVSVFGERSAGAMASSGQIPPPICCSNTAGGPAARVLYFVKGLQAASKSAKV